MRSIRRSLIQIWVWDSATVSRVSWLSLVFVTFTFEYHVTAMLLAATFHQIFHFQSSQPTNQPTKPNQTKPNQTNQTTPVEQSLSAEANNQSVSQETPHLLRNMKFNYRVHKSSLPRSCVTFRNQLCFGNLGCNYFQILQSNYWHVARMEKRRGVYRVLVERPDGKRPLGRPRRRWEDNIKLDLREIRTDGANWIRLAQDRVRWRPFVNTVMNLRVP